MDKKASESFVGFSWIQVVTIVLFLFLLFFIIYSVKKGDSYAGQQIVSIFNRG